MVNDTAAGVVGGFAGSPDEAFNPPAASGCCGGPAPATEAGAATEADAATGADAAPAASTCCGTVAEAQAEGSCCGSAAKAEVVAAGGGCCG